MEEKEVRVSDQHVWVGVEDRHVHLGLTNFIQAALGTILSVELPDIGDQVEAGEIFAEIESTSTVHEFVSPISGRVLAVNPQLEEHPSIINEDPYSEGWLIEVRVKNDLELGALMGMDEYYNFVFKDKS
jgi:glycine cleavage system H protein